MAAMVKEASEQISNSERQTESSRSNIDLMNKLPNSLRIEIISLLPTKEAVQTGVLNKSWRNLWKQIHSINFSSLRKELRAFANFLETLDSSITKNKFSLRFHSNARGSHDKLESCLSWAVKHDVKMLALDIKIRVCNFQRLDQVQAVLFQCKSLVQLELCIDAPLILHNRTASWPLLKVLNLTGMKLKVIEFNNLMESCPLLERLSLVRCQFWVYDGQSSQIRICSTTLWCLKLWKCRIGVDFDVVLKLPSLIKISIDMDMGHDGPAKGRALWDVVSHVEEVHLGQSYMQAMCEDGIKKSATVKHVQVEITVDDHIPWQGMAYLISSYSNLQTLVVNFIDIRRSLRIGNFQRVLDGGKVLEDCLSGMLNLKTIHVCGIKVSDVKELIEDTNKDQIGNMAEFSRKMKFNIVRILLKKFIHLEKMWIYVAAKGCSYFGSEFDLVEKTRKLFEKACPRPTLQVTCEPYDSPVWLAMPEN